MLNKRIKQGKIHTERTVPKIESESHRTRIMLDTHNTYMTTHSPRITCYMLSL